MEQEARVGDGTVVIVANHHYECCGGPPNLTAEKAYTAYFENDYGEQLVFQYDHKQKKGTLWHGDCGWEKPVEVMAGASTLVLSDEEREWLQLVWQVATRRESKEFQVRSRVALTRAWIAEYDNILSLPDLHVGLMRGVAKAKKKLEEEEGDLTKLLVDVQAEEAAGHDHPRSG